MFERGFTVAFGGIGLHATACWGTVGGLDVGCDGPYVLFLHGGGPQTSSEGTRYLRADLAEQGISSVALDFSGHGRSGGRLEDSSLRQRCEEALRLVDSLQARPHAIVATSMAGHTACRLLEAVRPQALVLFCPAAYETWAETARFGEEFRNVIRSTRHFDASPAFDALRRFEGRLLCFYGALDAVIPPEVSRGYALAASWARSSEYIELPGAGHRLHDWIAVRPWSRRGVADRLARAMAVHRG